MVSLEKGDGGEAKEKTEHGKTRAVKIAPITILQHQQQCPVYGRAITVVVAAIQSQLYSNVTVTSLSLNLVLCTSQSTCL